MLCPRLTVEFSPPWWVGTLERWEDGRYEVGRVVFGAEPTEPEVLLWVLHRLSRLRTTPAMEAPTRRPEAQNPKRRQRQIAREQGVDKSAVRHSVKSGKAAMRKYLKKFL